MLKDNLVFSKSSSPQMFNEIASKYDFLNHFLSFGLDISWRKKLAKFLPERNDLKILDLATGTADVLLSLVKDNIRIQSAQGVDLAQKMLDIGRKKIKQRKLDQKITLNVGDCKKLSFPDTSFDAVTIAFGIRNVDSPKEVLKEMYRVLVKQGRAVVLEFSLPRNLFIRGLHLFYLRYLVPLIGGFFSGHSGAYRYLNQTIESFPYAEAFLKIMKESGFGNTKAYPLFFGTASIYVGEKC